LGETRGWLRRRRIAPGGRLRGNGRSAIGGRRCRRNRAVTRIGPHTPLALLAGGFGVGKFDPLGCHTQFAAFGAILRFPAMLAQAPLDEHPAAFFQVLGAKLGRVGPSVHIHKCRFFLPFVRLAVFGPSADGQPQFGQSGPAGGVAEFGIARQIANEHHLIQFQHRCASFPSNVSPVRVCVQGSPTDLTLRCPERLQPLPRPVRLRAPRVRPAHRRPGACRGRDGPGGHPCAGARPGASRASRARRADP